MSVFLVEHKTTSEDVSPGADYWKRLRIDPQVSNYFVGARSLGFDAVECLYDVVVKPAIKPRSIPLLDESGSKIVLDSAGERVRTKDGKKWRETGAAELGYTVQTREEAPEEYGARLRADIADTPDAYYARGIIVRLEHEARNAANDAYQTGLQINDSMVRGIWPRNPDACIRYGRTCDYFRICSGEDDIGSHRFRNKENLHSELSTKVHLPMLTTSSMRTYRRCPAEYYYNYRLGIESVEKAAALRFGSLLHLGIEVWWRTVDLDAAIEAMAGEADPYERVKAEELMRGYHFRWKNEQFSVLAVEREFSTRLTDGDGRELQGFLLGGKIDAIAKHSEI